MATSNYKDINLNLKYPEDADIMCYLDSMKKKGEAVRSIEILINCIKHGSSIPISFILPQDYLDKCDEDKKYRLPMHSDADEFLTDVKKKATADLWTKYRKPDIVKALIRMTIKYPADINHSLPIQMLMNYIHNNLNLILDKVDRKAPEIKPKEEYKAEEIKKDLKTEEKVSNKQEIKQANPKEPSQREEDIRDYNIKFSSSGKIEEEKKAPVVNTASNPILNRMKRR